MQPSSPINTMLVVLLDLVPAIVGILITTIVAPALRAWLNAKLSEVERRRVLEIARGVYWVVEGISSKTPTTSDDKAAKAMKMLLDELAKDGKEADAATKQRVQNIWGAMAAQQKADEQKMPVKRS